MKIQTMTMAMILALVSVTGTFLTGNAAAESAKYQAYSADAFAAVKDKKRVLFFHAGWCPFCRVSDIKLSQNAGSFPKDAVVFKVDFDSAKDLKAKYAVTKQDTFVQVDSKGEKVTSWSGYADLAGKIQ